MNIFLVCYKNVKLKVCYYYLIVRSDLRFKKIVCIKYYYKNVCY